MRTVVAAGGDSGSGNTTYHVVDLAAALSSAGVSADSRLHLQWRFRTG